MQEKDFEAPEARRVSRTPSAPHSRRSAAGDITNGLLALQRTAGNKTVTSLIAELSDSSRLNQAALQRQDVSTEDAPTSYPGDIAENPPPESADERAARLQRDYNGWMAEGNYPEAAEALNGFNLGDMNDRLKLLGPDQIAQLHLGALSNPRLGPMSQIALVTGVDQASDGISWWQKNEQTIWDLAVGKGLVIIGEQVGARAFPQKLGGFIGGIIGWAIDFAISPGGDTQLPHTIFQAAVNPEGIPVPVVLDGQVAQWHRNRENAQKDADAYTAKTGEPAIIDEQYSKDPDDPE